MAVVLVICWRLRVDRGGWARSERSKRRGERNQVGELGLDRSWAEVGQTAY